jgi:sarcosine oxidase subunit beta
MPETTDVVVVGAGINGLCLALHLARQGAGRVLVLERRQVAAGATGKSGGLVRAHYANEAETRLALEGLRAFHRWADVVGGDCGFQRVGLLVIVPPDRLPQLERNVAWQRALGMDSRLIAAAEARELDPALRLDEAITHVAYEPDAGYADANLTVRSLVAALGVLDVEIRVGVEARAVLHEAGRVHGVATDGGPVAAPVVALAAGAWANGLLDPLGIDLGLRPAMARVGVYLAPPERPWPHPIYVDNAQRSWSRPVAGAATLIGLEATVDRYPGLEEVAETVSQEFLRAGAAALTDRFPVMRSAVSRGGWACAFMESPDSRPVIGALPGYEGLFTVAGDSGTSFKTAPAIGLGLAELILTGRSLSVDLGPFRADRLAGAGTLVSGRGYTAEPGTISR